MEWSSFHKFVSSGHYVQILTLILNILCFSQKIQFNSLETLFCESRKLFSRMNCSWPASGWLSCTVPALCCYVEFIDTINSIFHSKGLVKCCNDCLVWILMFLCQRLFSVIFIFSFFPFTILKSVNGYIIDFQ